MVEALVVYTEPLLPFVGSESNIVSFDSPLYLGHSAFVDNVLLETLVIEGAYNTCRATAFASWRFLFPQKRYIVPTYDGSNISHTAVANFDCVHVEDLAITMVLVEVRWSQA